MFARLLIICALWAALYLPLLGASGLRSEEPKRVMPAVEMLATGDFLVPRLAGEPYLRKPPLVNWLVAASFKICGARNDWTMRLPSALSVLAVALAFAVLMRRELGGHGSLGAALAWLTSLGMIEKGRMIEIEAVYVALFAFGVLFWLKWWREVRSPWLTWTVPWIFLGLGMLAKGPALLLFFYALVLGILWRAKKLPELFQPAHLFGLVLMLAIFAAWAVPYTRAIHAQHVAQTWSAEVASRFTGEEIDFKHWALNFPLGIAYVLPFGLLLPFIRPNEWSKDAPLARGLLFGAFIPFVGVLLLPGALPRYILPTLVPACLLIGFGFKHDTFRAIGSLRFVWGLITLTVLGAMILYPLRSATTQRAQSIFERVAQPIDAAIPPAETLYAINPHLQPYLFYVRAKVRYLHNLEELPLTAHFVAIPPKLESALRERFPNRSRLLARTYPYRGKDTLVFALAAE